MDKGVVVNPNGSGTDNTLHMLTEANTALNSLFPKECVTINPRSEIPDLMGTPMTGKNIPSKDTQKSSLNQSTSSSSSQNPSSPKMTNTLPPTSYPMPSSPPKNITPSFPMPAQDNMPAISGSGSHNMMP